MKTNVRIRYLSLFRWFVVAGSVVLMLRASSAVSLAAQEQQSVVKRESFDRDPGWEGIHNRLAADKVRKVTQDFGFSETRFASQARGEIGGQVTRAARLAYYAAPQVPVTLDQKLSASGTFVLEKTAASGGVFLGWFFHDQPDTSRPTNSLGLHIDTEASGGRLAIRLISGSNKSCGQFVTHFTPGGHRPTPLRHHVKYGFVLTYDPAAAGGRGRVEFKLSGHDPKDEIDSPIGFDLPQGFRADATTFDRFGIVNMRKGGGPVALYVDDLRVGDTAWDFSSDPQWDGRDNRLTYDDREQAGAHDFGFSETRLVGGKTGEIGGAVWRTDDNWAWYADRVGPLSLDQPLHASGKIVFTGADPDSGSLVGWFSSSLKDDQLQGSKPPNLRDFVGVRIEGPTRVGHYFLPLVVTSQGEKAVPTDGPVLVPDSRPHTWSFDYDPAANSGRGAIRVTLDEKVVTLDFPAGRRSAGAKFDRFGILNVRQGGGRVKVFLDDLEYTQASGVR